MMGTRIIFVITIINMGLLMLFPAVFLTDNYAMTTIASAFGFTGTVTSDLDSSGANITVMNENQNTTEDSLGLSESGGGISANPINFFSPFLFIFDFVKAIFKFAFAPMAIGNALGMPWQLRWMFGAPIGILYILALAEFIRGAKF